MLKEKLTLQEYLSLGYIYLIVLGIISDVIYFRFLGVDILNYSTILDALISPINVLTKSLKLFFMLVCIIGMSYLLIRVLLPKYHQKYREKKWYNLLGNREKADKMVESIKVNKGIPFLLFYILSMFLGVGIGQGRKVKSKIENQTFEVSHLVTFSNDLSKEVYVVGQNSLYLFYVLEGEKEVSITSINPNIKVIKRINVK